MSINKSYKEANKLCLSAVTHAEQHTSATDEWNNSFQQETFKRRLRTNCGVWWLWEPLTASAVSCLLLILLAGASWLFTFKVLKGRSRGEETISIESYFCSIWTVRTSNHWLCRPFVSFKVWFIVFHSSLYLFTVMCQTTRVSNCLLFTYINC